MQKLQEIFLPDRLWEWRALTTTAAIQTGARQPRPRWGGDRVSGNRIEEMAVLMPWAFEHEDIADEHEQAAQV
jgi:hypothetical protein